MIRTCIRLFISFTHIFFFKFLNHRYYRNMCLHLIKFDKIRFSFKLLFCLFGFWLLKFSNSFIFHFFLCVCLNHLQFHSQRIALSNWHANAMWTCDSNYAVWAEYSSIVCVCLNIKIGISMNINLMFLPYFCEETEQW